MNLHRPALTCWTLLLAWAAITAAQQPTRPKIYGISHVAVYASNPAATDHFLTGLLGMRQNTHWKAQYRINRTQGVEVETMPNPAPANLIAHIAFLTNDCEAMRKYLAAHGVKVPDHVDSSGSTHWFGFHDPSGNPFEFVQAAPFHLIPAHPVSHHMIHAGFAVTDRAAEDHLFKDILGFHLYWYGGMKTGHTDWVDMQVPDGTDWFEYMLVPKGKPLSKRVRGILNHYALGVSNLHNAVRQLEAHGWKPQPGEKPQIGRDGKWQLNLYDPDGTRVELMEFRPTRKPCCSPYVGKHPHP